MYKPLGSFRVASFRLQFLPSLHDLWSSYRETILLWFKPTLIFRKGLGLNEEYHYRVGNRHFVYKPMGSFRVASFRLQFLLSLNELWSSCREIMLLWFKSTLTVRKGLGLKKNASVGLGTDTLCISQCVHSG